SAEECAHRLRSTDDTPLALGDWQPAPATRTGRRRIAAVAATTLAVACAGVVLALNTPQPHPAPHNVSDPHGVVQSTTTHAPTGTTTTAARPSTAQPATPGHSATVVNQLLPKAPAGPPPMVDKGNKGTGKDHGKVKGHGGDE
ncbi:MAG TPA: hypothetical protein VHF06_26820, partial [Pseudonocardiaceae bacterium]|nr:hypothetical protein [Pseudonocardiaceae bacterium]